MASDARILNLKILVVLIHIFVCLGLIIIVLLQKGKGASMGAVFGGSSQTVFGSSGATTFLSRVTTAIAIIFMLTSLGLSIFFGKGRSSSVMEGVSHTQVPVAESPASPATPQDAGGAADKQ
jgi:preprotein translocase subunit SecG